MTRAEAFEIAMAEIKKYGYNVQTRKIQIPKPGELKDGAFFSFFEDPKTGDGFCRTYIFDIGKEQTVSFFKIKNYDEWKEKTPVLVENYLTNGVFLYRNSNTDRKVKTETNGNIISLIFSRELDRVPF